MPLESLGYVFDRRDEIHAFFEGHPVGPRPPMFKWWRSRRRTRA